MNCGRLKETFRQNATIPGLDRYNVSKKFKERPSSE